MKTYKIIFQDSKGNELFNKVDQFYDEKDATDYANKIVANSRENAVSFEIYKA